MKEAEFRTWLEARRFNGKPLTTVSNRMAQARWFEKQMPGLGLPDGLDLAFDQDGLAGALSRLKQLVKQAEAKEALPQGILPGSTNPAMRLRNVTSAVRNYRDFRAGKSPGAESTWPELHQMREAFLDRVPEFERFTATDNAYEQVERAYKDAMIDQVRAISASNDDDAAAGRRIYKALMPQSGPLLRWQTADAIEKKTPGLVEKFYAHIGALARSNTPIVSSISSAIDALGEMRMEGATVLTPGQCSNIAFTVAGMARPAEAAPFQATLAREAAMLLIGDKIFDLNSVTQEQVEKWLNLLHRVFAVMRDDWHWEPRDLVDVQGFLWTALSEEWLEEDAPEEEADEDGWITLFDSAGVAYRPRQERNLQTGEVAYRIKPAGASNQTADAIETNDVLQVARALIVEGRPVRIAAVGASTANYLKFPGKLVSYRLRPDIASELGVPADSAPPNSSNQGAQPMRGKADSANLILYGPPGTGKTYATAREAVRLCGEAIPEGRSELMKAYHQLVEAGRIEFVTFHQSYSYEDFVEGLRPPMDEDDGAEPASPGLRLMVHDGVFKRISEAARLDAAPGGEANRLDRSRGIFKIALGQRGVQESQIEDGLRENLIHLGWGGDIDWSDERFDSFEEIYHEWRRLKDPVATGKDANIELTYTFRTAMQVGDYVVLSDGRDRFRAVGRITGEYYYDREASYHPHRRKVEWLWIDRDGADRELFYPNYFRRHSTYRLNRKDVDWDALDRIVFGASAPQPGNARPYVLIIDEINRANISKVMGELITLIEPDKRIGAANELRLRLPYSRDMFGVPANLHIVGTMNTADRSIALLDTALRRRFRFKEVAPEPDLLADAAAATGIPLPVFLRTINDRIEYLLDREHRIGHAFFINCRTADDVHAAMRDAVIPLLQEYFFEDWGRVAAVLGEGKKGGNFLACREIRDPFGGGEARQSWSVLRDFDQGAYARCIAGKAALPASNDDPEADAEAAA